MIPQLLISLRAIVVFTLLTGILYPLAITGIAQLVFSHQANGSLVKNGDALMGSELLAQKFTDPRNFWPRPSAADYATVASGASNQGFTSTKLVENVKKNQAIFGGNAPADLLYASGSGLDPHISPEAARFQIARVASNRNLPIERVAALVESLAQSPQFGLLGEPRVNVFLLNQALNAIK